MSAIRQRIERLERMNPPADTRVFLIQWEGEPMDARHGGEVIQREAGESADAFKERAAERFRPTLGLAAVWMRTAGVHQVR